MRPYHGLCPQRLRPEVPSRKAAHPPARLSDLILAVLGVGLLGALAMIAGLAAIVPAP